MKLIQLLNTKNKGFKFIFFNILSIIIFTILYYIADIKTNYEFDNPWYYWLYFSSITQTTLGYSGIQIENKNINFMSLKSNSLKVLLFLQIFTMIVMNGYFIAF